MCLNVYRTTSEPLATLRFGSFAIKLEIIMFSCAIEVQLKYSIHWVG